LRGSRASRFGPQRTFVFAFVLGAVTAVTAGVLAAPRKGDGPYPRLEIFAKVLAHIENNYVEEVDETKLIYGAVRGMISTLDPHTSFMEPGEYDAMRGEAAGKFGGLGFEFAQKEGALVVVSPIDDTPAARAGLKAGDLITGIDDYSTRTMSIAEATTRLRGAPGTPVTLMISRPEFSQPRPFSLVREQIRVISVEGRLMDGAIGYVRIKSFQDRTDLDLKVKLDQIRKEAGAGFQGLVLDLRNNPGGLLDQGVKVADRFLAKGVIVETRGRNGKHREVESATLKDTEPDYPVVILINRGTASASEVVAGALQDYSRAVLIGATSFGKGSVQTVIDLDDGSALKLTIARYYTPSGRSIQAHGIVPDVLVAEPQGPRPEALGEDILPNHFRNEKGSVPPPSIGIPGDRVIPAMAGADAISDPQLRAGVSAIHSWAAFKRSLEEARAAAKSSGGTGSAAIGPSSP
jgi:carboxyl-terminal processing protease